MRFQRIFGVWTWRAAALGGVSAALFAAAALLLGLYLPADDDADFAAAALRIDQRIRPGELVILHPPGNAWYIEHFERHQVLAPRKLEPRDVEDATGLWFVTDRGDRRVRQVFHGAIRRFRRQGRASFGRVTLFHYWEPRGGGE